MGKERQKKEQHEPITTLEQAVEVAEYALAELNVKTYDRNNPEIVADEESSRWQGEAEELTEVYDETSCSDTCRKVQHEYKERDFNSKLVKLVYNRGTDEELDLDTHTVLSFKLDGKNHAYDLYRGSMYPAGLRPVELNLEEGIYITWRDLGYIGHDFSDDPILIWKIADSLTEMRLYAAADEENIYKEVGKVWNPPED